LVAVVDNEKIAALLPSLLSHDTRPVLVWLRIGSLALLAREKN